MRFNKNRVVIVNGKEFSNSLKTKAVKKYIFMINRKLFNFSVITILLSALGACSFLPGGSSPAADSKIEDTSSSSVTGDSVNAPAGFDVGAPNVNPYLAEEIKVPGPVLSAFTRAITAMQNHQWSRAEVILQELTSSNSDLSGPFLNLGIVYRQSKKTDKAEQAFEQAILVNPLNIEAHNQLGLLKREAGDFQAAEQHYLAAIKVWPKHANSHKNIGILYDLYMGESEKALQHFEIFQYLQTESDRQMAGWIIDLQRRMARK